MAATATAPRPKAKEQVETTESTEVVVDSGLRRLVVAWKKDDDKSGQGWMQIAKYVVDKEEISNKELKKALIDYRGLTENSAKTTASHMLSIRKSTEAQALLNRALKGDKSITVYDLRSSRARKGEQSTADTEELFSKKLATAARFAINKGLVQDEDEFVEAARSSWRAIIAAAEEQAAEEGTEQEAPEEEDEDET